MRVRRDDPDAFAGLWLALDRLMWEHDDDREDDLAGLYESLLTTVNSFALGHFRGEDLGRFLRGTGR